MEVLADRGAGAHPRWRCGSGFLIDGRHVLTSLHAVIDGVLTIRRVGATPGAPKQAWPATLYLAGDLNNADLAILALDEDLGPLSPATYAQVPRSTPQPVVIKECSAVGFPKFAARSDAEDAIRDTVHVEGCIPNSQNLASGLLTLKTTHTPQPLPSAQSGLTQSPWSGMSGAAVLAGGQIVGVVSEHAPRQGPSDLTLVPITHISTLPDAGTWWATLGADPDHLPQVGVGLMARTMRFARKPLIGIVALLTAWGLGADAAVIPKLADGRGGWCRGVGLPPGPILAAYLEAQKRDPALRLGCPLGPVTATADGRGLFAAFGFPGKQQLYPSRIYWSRDTGAHIVWGEICLGWDALKAESGPLGFPVDEEKQRDQGYHQKFEHGWMYWHPQRSRGAHWISKEFFATWTTTGSRTGAWEGGPLGYPISDQMPTSDGGQRQAFEDGAIVAHPTRSNGSHAVMIKIYEEWLRHGAEAGDYGYPVAAEVHDGGIFRQKFERDEIVWDDVFKKYR
ncbi:trypsin-like peptidase domain-containing protein [Actinocorallia lasiicapitis]